LNLQKLEKQILAREVTTQLLSTEQQYLPISSTNSKVRKMSHEQIQN